MDFKRPISSFFLTVIILTSGCGGGGGSSHSSGSTPGTSSASTISQRLRENFINEIVISLFSELDAQAGNLSSALMRLDADRSSSNLEAAKAAWIAARIPWERSEAALFGPADIFGIDPAIDSWPLSEGDLNRVLGSSSNFSEQSVAQLENTLKGFHAIEFLLFGNGGDRTASSLSKSQTSYAAALGAALRSETKNLLQAWTKGINGQPAYAEEFLNAGAGSTTFPTEQIATEQVIRGLITIATEVADSKIEEPFVARNPNLVESQYSFNSTDDFANNIHGIEIVLERVLKELISSRDANLSERVLREAQRAQQAILAIPRPFRSAILNPANDRSIQDAQAAIRQLRTTLETEVLGLAS